MSKAKFLQLAKGFNDRQKNCPRVMIPRVHRKLQYQYIGRKQKRRVIRQDWIKSITAATQEHGVYYNEFIWGLNRSNVKLDRKILCDLA